MEQPFIERIMVGMPRTYGRKEAKQPMDREWTSGIVKQTVKGKIWAGKTNLQGDGQADLKHHGGPEKAIFVYPVSHYNYWQKRLQKTDFTVGAFGENLAVQHITEDDLCIGDIFHIGGAIVQVSQPRQPCWKPARRWKIKDLALQIQQQGRTGWYFRVLKEGEIQAGDQLQLQERPFPEWTVARCNDVMHNQKHDLGLAARLAACELLASNWRTVLNKRAQGEGKLDIRNRVIGPNE
ncbi:MOSC domain-containing protein [Bacillus sp. FJAT-50079]|uniref:MOSC domain-containing protein n=1 Tax=Bacillus sp. FJAT-50079 TaxID=2833577 RepID=UPI001BC959A5|nr:MOSC domain-containing protein [Bacillus sp. FJAT-50079]MBS4207295.1 MOSC domain-containing protein [Bacillus sp. FJAT-50079]